MFKKKLKKDQGVLLADQDPANQPRDKQPTLSQPTPELLQPSVQPISQPRSQHPTISGPASHKTAVKAVGNERGRQSEASFLKRAKDHENLYETDARQQLDNEPKRREKQGYVPIKHRGVLGSSTFGKKEQIKQQVQEAFDDRTYRAGVNMVKDLNLEEDELEEEAAKRRFLENIQKTKLVKEGKLNTKIYRGANAYPNHKMTTHDIQNAEDAYKKKMGPSRINSTIKNSCRFDYVLNLCKDWHDSGYCPFGNSCLYLHDRSNHKTGWELEKDFQEQQRERWKRINNPDMAKQEDRQKLLKTIQKYKPPTVCEGCAQAFKSPVEMQCGHIFCSPCAIKMVKCRICNKRLSGIMNNAAEKLSKLTQNYEDMLAKLQNEHEENSRKRRKFQHVSGLDVFAD